jgi:hypothetical protein
MVNDPPVQPVPDQPANIEPDAAVAVSVTAAPLLKLAEQVLPQLMPAGELVTVPLPVPAFATVRLKLWRLKVAVQVVLAVIVSDPLEQPVPDQPAKTELEAGVAVSVTIVPLSRLAEHVLPQSIAVELLLLVRLPMAAEPLVTVPLPVPAFTTVRL